MMELPNSLNDFLMLGSLALIVTVLWIKFLKTGYIYKSTKTVPGKTVLITGGNNGIGKETAIELAKRKARVIIACRNESKALKALKEIREASGGGMVYFMKLDLSDFESIRKFAAELISTEPKLDILINNAGATDVGLTKDGYELMFGTNHLGPFLLTYELMPLLKKTARHSPVRIINVGSEAYKMGKIDFENISPKMTDPNVFQVMAQYSNSKLMNVYFTSELHRKLRVGDPACNNITTYCVHPGRIASHLGGDLSKRRGLFSIFLRQIFLIFFACPVKYGCQTSLYCSLENGIEKDSGRYFSDLAMEKLLPHARDSETAEKLWKVSEEFTKINWQ